MKSAEEKVKEIISNEVDIKFFGKKRPKPTSPKKILNYLSKKKQSLLKSGNIHRYHIVDLPYSLRRHGYIIPTDFILFDNPIPPEVMDFLNIKKVVKCYGITWLFR